MRCIAIATVGLLTAGSVAHPCSLERLATREEALASGAIFVGLVEDVRDQLDGSPDPNYARRVRLQVRDVWKGPRRDRVTVWTFPGGCGTPFTPGGLFIVFAGGDPLVTSLIFPSQLVTTKDADAWLQTLGRPTWRNPRWKGVGALSKAPPNNQLQQTARGASDGAPLLN